MPNPIVPKFISAINKFHSASHKIKSAGRAPLRSNLKRWLRLLVLAVASVALLQGLWFLPWADSAATPADSAAVSRSPHLTNAPATTSINAPTESPTHSSEWAQATRIAIGVPPEPSETEADSDSETATDGTESGIEGASEDNPTQTNSVTDTPEATPDNVPTAENPEDDEGHVIVGERKLFQLQPFATFTGQDRADLVMSRIHAFLQPDNSGRIPEPRITSDFNPNGQHIIRLSDRNAPFNANSINLLTVTRHDVAAASDEYEQPADVSLGSIGRTTREWTQLLGPAIRTEWELRRARQQQKQPLSIALGILAAIAIGIAAYLLTKVSDRGVRLAQERILAKSNQNLEFLIDFAAYCIRWLLRLLLGLLAIHLSLSVLPILALFQQKLYQRVYQALAAVWAIFNRPLLPSSSVSVLSIAAFIILASFMFTGARRLSDSIKRQLLSRLIEDVGSRESISTVFKYLITALGVLISLPLIGIDLGSLAIATGAVGLGIGIGLQNLSRNFISGIVMLFERPIQVGDFVDVDGLQGTIEHINLRATIVRTLDSVNVIVPNSRFMEENVVSWSYRDSRCRLHLPIGVAYGADTEAVKYALLKVASEQPRVLKSPAPQVFFKGFGDSSLNFDLLVWTLRPADQFKLVSDLNFAIDAEFRQEGINIPFPQRELHIRTTPELERFLSGQSEQNGRSSSPGTTDNGTDKREDFESNGVADNNSANSQKSPENNPINPD